MNKNKELAWELAETIDVLQVNDATLKLFGAESAEDFVDHIGVTFGPQMIDVFINELCAMWDHQKHYRDEASFVSLDGRDIDALITFRVPQTAEEYKSVSVSIIDITDRKQAEEAMHEAMIEADRSNKAKSQFLESMSHELRTPLNAILGFAQVMQINKKSPLTPQQNEHVECIINGGTHLLELVNEVLDLAKIEANQMELDLEKVDANKVINECLTLISPLGEQKNITVVNAVDQSTEVILKTDYRRFKQVLINLLSNAIKYNKESGSVRVQSKITKKAYLRLSVIDTGIGIAPDDRDKVFQMFHRVGADSMITREGTGIGLTVTKLLTERMAGSIDFDSTLGKGSHFWIELPLALNKDILIWNEKMRIGIESLDRDHQFLISLLNRALHDDLDAEALDKVLEELHSYTDRHFREEETVMKICGYPDLTMHQHHHREIVRHLKEFQEEWQENRNADFIDEFQTVVRKWLFDHIMEDDAEIADYIEGNEQEIRHAIDTQH